MRSDFDVQYRKDEREGEVYVSHILDPDTLFPDDPNYGTPGY